MSYIFWNKFVSDWANCPPNPAIPPHPSIITGWSNPNGIPLMNTTHPGDYSFQYLPEPWWGNSGNDPLHCVFLNHNPASGGVHQSYPVAALGGTYQQLVEDEVAIFHGGIHTDFRSTCLWHKNSRANRVIDALNALTPGIAIARNDIRHLLSIEFIPWHTKFFDVSGLTYLLANHTVFSDSVLLFAAKESRRIANPVLKNKVLLRTNRKRIEIILSTLAAKGDIAGYTLSPKLTEKAHTYDWDYFTIDRAGFEDVIFFRIQHIKNDLPGYNGMLDFLTNVSNVRAPFNQPALI